MRLHEPSHRASENQWESVGKPSEERRNFLEHRQAGLMGCPSLCRNHPLVHIIDNAGAEARDHMTSCWALMPWSARPARRSSPRFLRFSDVSPTLRAPRELDLADG